jgi:hypothetical protein
MTLHDRQAFIEALAELEEAANEGGANDGAG